VTSPAGREQDVIAPKERQGIETKRESGRTFVTRNIAPGNERIGFCRAALPTEKKPKIVFLKFNPDSLFSLVHPFRVWKNPVVITVFEFERKDKTGGFRDDFPNRVSES
jgi:hypothetical protein